MARRVPTQVEVAEESQENAPSMPGGAPGVEPEANKPASHLAAQFQPPDPEELAKLPRPKVFRVTNGGRFVQSGMPVQIRVGSRVSEATHDLAALKQQGIHLEEILSG